jgi:N-acetyl-alpha-D-glucosaminyl L-malate synthase BshA
MSSSRPLKIGITCYPTVGGSGILAAELGQELAARGHEIHFISYDRPFRVPPDEHGIFFHRVQVNDYDLFKYPDYTLPLSVKMTEVTRDHGLDLLHVHYAVPHATAALLAQSMLPEKLRPKLITTLHGTDTMLLGRDPGYGPAIRHALECSDAITTVSDFLKRETLALLPVKRPIEVIHNFFEPAIPKRSREEVRRELGLRESEAMVLHASNLRPLKRIDLLLEVASRIRPRESFKLVLLAGGEFAPFAEKVRQLGLSDRVVVRERVTDIEDYLNAADLGLFTSDLESFCLSLLETMNFARPSVATRVGGIPEVTLDGETGLLAPAGDADALTKCAETLIADSALRAKLGAAAKQRARNLFSAEAIVPKYEALYRRICRS